MAKVPARRIPSDDFAVEVDGVIYHPHEGEWIEIVGQMKVAVLKAFDAIRGTSVALQTLGGDADPTAAMELVAAMDQHFEVLCRGLADRIVAWSWTDDVGDPLPSPYRNPQVLIDELSTEEVYYLYGVVNTGGNVSDRGKDSPPSPTISSATAPTPIPTRPAMPVNHMSGS